MKPVARRVCMYLFSIMLCGLILYINVTTLWESYGNVPPYYGRTTNMDKWTSPWPVLVIIDVLALLLYLGIRRCLSQKV